MIEFNLSAGDSFVCISATYVKVDRGLAAVISSDRDNKDKVLWACKGLASKGFLGGLPVSYALEGSNFEDYSLLVKANNRVKPLIEEAFALSLQSSQYSFLQGSKLSDGRFKVYRVFCNINFIYLPITFIMPNCAI